VLTGIRTPQMNAIMERWVQTCRHELLDRTLICNESHLRHALHEFEKHHNSHRPTRHQARQHRCAQLPSRSTTPRESLTWTSADTTDSPE
jgi:hypothetical protein